MTFTASGAGGRAALGYRSVLASRRNVLASRRSARAPLLGEWAKTHW